MLQRLFRFGFLAAIVVVLVSTLAPARLVPSPFNDKVEHCLAFAGLVFLGALGWPSRARTIALALVALGGAIELIQSTPLIARDAEFLDFVADTVGVALGLGCAAVARNMITAGGASLRRSLSVRYSAGIGAGINETLTRITLSSPTKGETMRDIEVLIPIVLAIVVGLFSSAYFLGWL